VVDLLFFVVDTYFCGVSCCRDMLCFVVVIVGLT